MQQRLWQNHCGLLDWLKSLPQRLHKMLKKGISLVGHVATTVQDLLKTALYACYRDSSFSLASLEAPKSKQFCNYIEHTAVPQEMQAYLQHLHLRVVCCLHSGWGLHYKGWSQWITNDDPLPVYPRRAPNIADYNILLCHSLMNCHALLSASQGSDSRLQT